MIAIMVRSDHGGVTAAVYTYPEEVDKLMSDVKATLNTEGVTRVEIIMPDEVI